MRKIVLVVVLLLPFIAVAQDIEKGIAAAKAGDGVAALAELLPLAEQGHSLAQFTLGELYFEGNGVQQDFEEGEKWVNASRRS